ncbi:(Fe-S)-binding protein [soil metagenome]
MSGDPLTEPTVRAVRAASTPERPARVALFPTCVADLATPGPAAAAVELLEACGFEVVVPPAATCCGQPPLTSGFPGEARRLATHWLDTFGDAEAVVVPSGSCTAMVHHHYPRLLAGADLRRARDLAARTYELSQFLVAFGADLPLRLEATVTYHDSCHMQRALGEAAAPRELLGRVEGLELVEMADIDLCCGFGGTFATSFPEVSVAMADARLAQAVETGTHLLVSSDAGCLLHLQGRATAAGVPVRTRHLALVLRDALTSPGGSP